MESDENIFEKFDTVQFSKTLYNRFFFKSYIIGKKTLIKSTRHAGIKNIDMWVNLCVTCVQII